jgi:peptidoglycan DL-endopeptidase CwlO
VGEDVMTTEHPESGQSVIDDVRLFENTISRDDERQADDRIAELQARVFALEAELEDARGEFPAAGDDPVTMQTQSGPRHEQISRRMLQILRLADEEAAQEREEAALHAAAVLERAQSEARSLLEAAELTAEELLRAAMLRCQEELAAARAEANRLVESARERAVCRPADTGHDGEQPGREQGPEVRAHLGSA